MICSSHMVLWVGTCRCVDTKVFRTLQEFISTKRQPQGHVQVLLNILRGFTAQAALDAPRFCISAGMPDAEVKGSKNAGDVNSEVYFEEGISESTVAKLRGQFCIVGVFNLSGTR